MKKLWVLIAAVPLVCSAQEATPTEPFLEAVPATQLDEIQVDIPKIEVILPKLNVTSETAFAVNLDTHEVVFAKNEKVLRSVASITKMMTAYVVLQQPDIDLEEVITLTPADIALSNKGSAKSKLRAGMHFTRERLLNLALMSSENRAAAALGRTTFKGGLPQFIDEMNKMAVSLGMLDTEFVDPIGIGEGNVSTASDLVRLVAAASSEELIRDFSTTKFKPIELHVRKSNKPTEYHNTNALVGFRDWNILVQKTGFTNAAGHCVVMVVDIQGQRLAVVVLNSHDNQQRAFDAIKIREWVEQGKELTTAEAQPLSPYQFVFYKKGKPVVVHKHTKRRKHHG